MTTPPAPPPSPPDPPLAPLSRTVVVWVAVGVALVIAGVVVTLWWAGTAGLRDRDLVLARLDALRIGLSLGLGGGGLFALYLAWRRQRATEIGLAQKQRDQADVARAYALQERTAAATEADAVARRITDLYTKAADQLGADRAPVRLAGLYALERLAQDHADQRQTIVNVVCAYLRMPFTPPAEPGSAEDEERRQEREVRLTAQRILAEHLRPGVLNVEPLATFWPDIDLDLTGATLVDFSLADCVVRRATFVSATFWSYAAFLSARFTEIADFREAEFTGVADFARAEFRSHADFRLVTFAELARFKEARFAAHAEFRSAAFAGSAQFRNATFGGHNNFSSATFAGPRRESVDHPRPWTEFDGAMFVFTTPDEIRPFFTDRGEN